ncbi:unnamed protein product, partial [Rotaria sp. Silwood1]
MTREALSELLVKWLRKFDLKLENVVGQFYDGASCMPGEYKGVATCLKQVSPSAKRHQVFEDIQMETPLQSLT